VSQVAGVAVISEGTALKGEIHRGRQVDVYGYVEGKISADRLIVHRGGRVYGTVRVGSAEVHGNLQGDISVKQLISIGSTGAVNGNVRYGRISMEQGGELAADMRNVPPELAGDLNLVVKRGGSVRITTVDLTAFDPDDSADKLTFTVSGAQAGHVAFAAAPASATASFTQADLQQGRVMFVHDGGDAKRASFNVVVADAKGATSGSAQTVTAAVI